MIKSTFSKYIAIFSIALLCYAAILRAPLTVRADYSYGQYGGPATPGQVLIDKLVRDPESVVYVDNLGINDPKFTADNSVFYKLIVKNTGGTTLSRITVVDYLPPYIEYVSGGEYDTSTRQVKFYFDNVTPGEQRSVVFQAKVVSYDKLPAEKSLICPINKVVAASNEDGSDEDTAQVCIERKQMVEKVPETGNPIGLLLGFGSLPTLFAGFKLRRIVS